jgi:hypothetical protein
MPKRFPFDQKEPVKKGLPIPLRKLSSRPVKGKTTPKKKERSSSRLRLESGLKSESRRWRRNDTGLSCAVFDQPKCLVSSVSL